MIFKVNPAKTVEEAEEWCKRQLERKCNNRQNVAQAGI